MNISVWDLFKYIFKWKFIICIVVIAAMLCGYMYVQRGQTYSATAIIRLNDDCILEGKAPDGKTYDSYEIVSPNVLTEVISELSLSKTVDSLRTRITVTPIVPDTEKEIRESKEKTGEKHEYFPNTFSVTYMGRVGEDTQQVRDILESVVNNYIEFYTHKYAKLASINDVAYSEEMGNYDYIDMAIMLSDNVDSIETTLNGYHQKDSKFRSTSTGLTFSDLAKEYKYLQEFKIAGVFTDIYSGQITKNKDLLLKSYIQKKEQYLTERQSFLDAAYTAKNRMDSFSASNKNVPNAYNETTKNNNDDLEIIEDLHDDINPYNTVTTYDELMTKYIDSCIAANNLYLKAKQCDVVIAKFTEPVSGSGNSEYAQNVMYEEIKNINKRFSELNKTANLLISDYNAYASAEHVSPLTGVNYYANMSVALYLLLAGGISGFLMVVVAITVELIRAMKKKEDTEESAEEPETEVVAEA